ncbi:hypothetical protein BDF14DRAFT_1873606 [Spinellus fusiger]|nr:hypothetical protein BDF14DRAFT_1873606 [Spinellus fusiger]
MRPDEHKAKQSRLYQSRKKKQGDTEAADIAQARKLAAAKARDKGTSVAAIRRRNGETGPLQQPSFSDPCWSEVSEQQQQQQFSRRKIGTNADRYQERSIEAADDLAQDAALGIDRETTHLVALLEDAEETSAVGASYFKFKEEQLWDSPTEQQEQLYQTLLRVDFDSFEGVLEPMDTLALLGLSAEEQALVESALGEAPVTVNKPIVPAFTKNAKGLVLMKSLVTTESKKEDGIYLRNDGTHHRPTQLPPNHAWTTQQEKEPVDDLDALLAKTEDKVNPPAHSPTKDTIVRPPTALPKLSKLSKLPKPPSPPSAQSIDDEAWLDDILNAT